MAGSELVLNVPDAVRNTLSDLLPKTVRVKCGVISDHRNDLSPAESQIVQRAVEKRQIEFSTGRFLAREALSDLGVPRTEILQGDQRRPLWPLEITGSISHSSGICAIAVARADEVSFLGIDIEAIQDVPEDILDIIASREEQNSLAGLFGKKELAAALFCIREAVFKAYYPATGHFLGHKDVTVDLQGDDFEVQIDSSAAPPLAQSYVINGRMRFHSGMVVATVAQEPLSINQ